MVEAIHRIGHQMGLKTIAEYVETDQTLAMLRQIGVDYVQGNGVHHPEPLENLCGQSRVSPEVR
jgi:EAL domain-containing protein (putative c-di-GMP-specific phosphodiesterase class I)